MLNSISVAPSTDEGDSFPTPQRMTEVDLIGALNRRSTGRVHVGKMKVARKLLKTRASSFAQLPSAHDTMTPSQIISFEVSGMFKAEKEQRGFKDTFWGFDRQAKDCRRERREMAAEDKRSLKHELYCEYVNKLAGWRQEEKVERKLQYQIKELEGEEKRMAYMEAFMNADSTNEVISYSWSGLDISDNNIDDEDQPYYSNSSFQADESLFDLDMENYAVSPGRATTMHTDGKLQTRIVAPNIKAETISPKRSSTGSVSESVYLQPGTWVKRESSRRGGDDQAASRATLRGKDKLLERSHKLRNMPQLLAEPKHTDELDGHPVHKWDQRHILRTVFTMLDKKGEGSVLKSTMSMIEVDHTIHALLRFTVFGAWIKQRKFGEFLKIFDKVTAENTKKAQKSGENQNISQQQPEDDSQQQQPQQQGQGQGQGQARMTVNQWVTAAREHAALEHGVKVGRIRTDEEHKQLSSARAQEDWSMLLDTEGGSGQAWFAENFRRRISVPLRDARLRRCLTRGDAVWGLHHSGCFWLPAVVESAASDGSAYTLRYPLTTHELQAARMTSSSKQFIPDLRANALELSAYSSDSVPVKPCTTEIETCSYVFDRIDTRSAGSMDARALVQMLQSDKYKRVVSTSYCLSQVVLPYISDELLKVVEDKAKLEKRSPSMMIMKSCFLDFCLTLQELSQLHDRTYYVTEE
jgi:hypothetical protein